MNESEQIRAIRQLLEKYDRKYMTEGELQSDFAEDLLDDLFEIVPFVRTDNFIDIDETNE